MSKIFEDTMQGLLEVVEISKRNTCKSTFDELLEKRLQDPDFKKEWDAIQPEMNAIRKEIERS